MLGKLEISCDDGSKYDYKLINLLEKYNLPCTFYIPCYSDLSDKEVKEISKKYEIGGHTVTHQILTECHLSVAEEEIKGCKKILEDITGKEITKFCYPRGRYDEDIKRMIKEAGFKEARTTRILWTEKNSDPYETHTTIHAFQNPKYEGVDWLEKAIEILNSRPKYYSLWGHSHEIERDNNWGKLEILFKKLNESISRSR